MLIPATIILFLLFKLFRTFTQSTPPESSVAL
jgi:hypothetical protein